MIDRRAVVEFLVESGALKFGDFTLKSGRRSPYFMNAGGFYTGSQLSRLGDFYAQCAVDNGLSADTVFGPAYKGIPLSVVTATALFKNHGRNVSYCFNRKEAKDHGEGGLFVGKQPQNGERVLIVDDVITSGKAVGEVLPVIKDAADVSVVGLVILVDREEKALDSDLSAVQQVKRQYGIDVYPIITFADIIAALENGVPGKEFLPAMKEYHNKFGVKNIIA